MTDKISPMMRDYLKTKEEYSDAIVFYRLGDFYEMFFDDAKLVSAELELTLTGKSCGMEERAPMCGVPYHAAENYINRLVNKGYKVAICEQMEDPKTVKGIVKREVVRIVTPGTNLNDGQVEEDDNNFIMSLYLSEDGIGIAVSDISTGAFFVTETTSVVKLTDEILKYSPKEIIKNDDPRWMDVDLTLINREVDALVSDIEDHYFEESTCTKMITNQFKAANLDALGLSDHTFGVRASGALIKYLYEMLKNEAPQLTTIKTYAADGSMVLDAFTRRNLELTVTMRDKKKTGSLWWVLDKTKTAMGARMLKSFIEQPLIKRDEIVARQDAIEELNDSLIDREELREYLSGIYDLERLLAKISIKTANPRDLLAFKNSIGYLPHIRGILSEFKCNLLKNAFCDLDTLDDIYALIDAAIVDEPPIQVKEGGIIKTSYNEEVEKLKTAKTKGTDWISELETKERERTGIKNLKVGFNKVFGYYLEITNSFKDMAPDDYIRKQTLTGAERYITPELKEIEDTVLGASERLNNLEYELFCELRDKIADEVKRIQNSARLIALIDSLISLSVIASENAYVRPNINENDHVKIVGGRHPVVEKMLERGSFIDNDTLLDNDDDMIAIITGPNMAGKSTYMRQVALIVLMAQIGSFVPAKSADICICDRIFTRVGASDDLASGQSTFMVEMSEVANILRNATDRSLLILDEIGRGTSTFDGLSIAWAVVEYIEKNVKAKTLFATHYHELTDLEGVIEGVKNYCIAVKENGDDIIFLRKIIPGGADKSYGIQVARLAGVPGDVIERAKNIAIGLNSISNISIENVETTTVEKPAENEYAEIIDEIRNLDVTNMTPIEAILFLNSIKDKL